MNADTMPAALVGCSADEWQIRCDLAAHYRLVAHHRWTDFVYTHISARLPGPEQHFLINRYGVMFHEMRASDLVKIDMHGNVVEDGDVASRRVNAAGFTIHSAVHMAREDLTCVVHTHTQAGIAVSCMKEGLLPLSQQAMKFYGRLAYHGYEGIALDLDERERLVRDLGQHKAMILRNHGLLVGGRRRSTRSTCWSAPAPPRWRHCLAGGSWCCRRPRCASTRLRSSPNKTPPTAMRGCGNRRCG
jgi:ribulose-5-phosphate 4-epimerase/fuculose-1-phosphate aldolase